MPKNLNLSPEPVFIHSLFRAGSTYLFNVFRRSTAGYWCYQESLHEVAFFCRDDPSSLGVWRGGDMVKELRHPPVGDSYFKELKEVRHAWKDALSAEIIYDAYFSGRGEDFGQAYWLALIGAARGRPVFQECRTSGRIGAVKEVLGGKHLYLWRNPWDQWWSYKVMTYFDTTNSLITQARNAPQAVRRMCASLGIAAYSGVDLGAAFAFYGERPLNSEQSYQLFYMLWCLAMREGMQYADMLLSIDQLSDSATYREECQARLQALGIDEVDFSDCAVPQGLYAEAECAWFAAQEARVHAFLLEDGWLLSDLQRLQALRQQYQPACWEASPSDVSPARLGEQASRARELAKRFESALATRVISEESRRVAVECELEQAKSAAHQAQLEVQRRAEQLAQAGSALELAKADLLASQTEAQVLQARLEERAAFAVERAVQTESLAAKAEFRVVELGAALDRAKADHVEVQTAAWIQQVHFVGRLGEQQTRLSALERQLADALTDNHYHWQLATERTEELARLSGLYDQVRQALLAGEEVQFRLAAESDRKSGEIQYWHQRVLDLHASTSWRLTKPLRGLKRLINGEVEAQQAARVLLASRVLRNKGQVLLGHGIRYAVRRPRLKALLRKLVACSPAIERRLIEMRTAQIHTDLSQMSSAFATASPSIESAGFSTHQYCPQVKRSVNEILDCIRSELRQQAGE